MSESQQSPEVLFLCTGNYYRSRTAEALFNHYAATQGVDARAISRGLGLSAKNKGHISPHALAWLQARGVPYERRDPLDLTAADLASARRIIAIDETEHRAMMNLRFPKWAARIEYWVIHDLDRTGPSQALAEIETRVRALFGMVGASPICLPNQ
ncbi:MAG: low molecular weight phosphatase family protein [Myxococcota bacterium]